MTINRELIRLALMIILILGGTLLIHYFRTGEWLIDELIGAAIGIVLFIFSLLWRNKHKQSN